MRHETNITDPEAGAFVVPRLVWRNLSSAAIDVANVRNGVRIELPALLYNEVVDFVNRERQSDGDWLHLDLTRQDELLLLTVTASTLEGQSTIRLWLDSEAPRQDERYSAAENAIPDNVVPIRASVEVWQTRSSNS